MHVESQSGRAGAGGTSIFQYDYECICKHKISAHGQWLPETVHVFNLGFAPLWSIDWQFISAACGYVLIGVTLIAGVNTSMTTGKGRMATIPDFEMKVESLSQHMSWHRYCHDEPCWQCVSTVFSIKRHVQHNMMAVLYVSQGCSNFPQSQSDNGLRWLKSNSHEDLVKAAIPIIIS